MTLTPLILKNTVALVFADKIYAFLADRRPM